ncbi:Alpha/Beta hydrolase protein [Pilobolus umbonatus]|nr:Alpha/Beta hydrolase protein [Pilobolus umbonatus]
MTYSWDNIRNQVRDFRVHLQSTYPLQVLTVMKDFTLDDHHLYFLSNTNTEHNHSRYLQIYKVELSEFSRLDWKPVFTEYIESKDKYSGITHYHIKDNNVLFTVNNGVYLGQIGNTPKRVPCKITSSFYDRMDPTRNYQGNTWSRVDPKLGGENNAWIAFIRQRDIWITDTEGNDIQLTFSSLNKDDPTLQCGIAEYMMQEEFHRSTGYEWCPSHNRILYLETTEKEVESVILSKSTNPIRYPRAGKKNARSELKIVEFQNGITKHKQLAHSLHATYPWLEYIVRFGWIGENVWVQLLSRDQKRTAVIRIEYEQFEEDIQHEILWQETNEYWINVTDVYYFMESSFIWSSEKTGYRHLYHVQASNVTQITSGEWSCVDRPIYVDEEHQLVYFSAKADGPLETHLYVVSLVTLEMKRITPLGHSHTITIANNRYAVDCYSSLHQPPTYAIHKLNLTYIEKSVLLLPNQSGIPRIQPSRHDTLSLEKSFLPNGEIFSFTTSDGITLYGCLYKPRGYQANKCYPTILHIYGGPKTQLVMNDFKFPRLMRYLMSVYFGFAVVVMDGRGSSDRGLMFEASIQYGLGTVELKDQIEGLLYVHQEKIGAEMSSEGELMSVIDLSRLAVTGWSYGGYLSLIALAKYSHLFKMAIAGAPVTQWELYDAAYTERYMGLPEEHKDAYVNSSVLTHVQQFPDNEHRLLIAHGLIDENVHYRNTELLVSELVKYNKPHYLQVYPTEKHGLRHANVNEHFETLMYYWLLNYL